MSKGFVFYEDYYKIGQALESDSERVEFYNAIFDRGFNGTKLPETNNTAIRVAFVFIESLISANEQKRKNGSKGGRPPKRSEKTEKNEKLKNSKTTEKPLVSYNVNVNDKVNVNNPCQLTLTSIDTSSPTALEGRGSEAEEERDLYTEAGWGDPNWNEDGTELDWEG